MANITTLSPLRRPLRCELPIGTVVGDLIVIGPPGLAVGKGKARVAYPCRCICGQEVAVLSQNLANGRSTSCGCVRIARQSAIATKHGESRSRLWTIWMGMKNRCEVPSGGGYKFYGGRGISVCTEWHDFAVFRTWAHANGYMEGLSIDRRNPNGNYEPSNCHWIPLDQQKQNTRRAVLIPAFGESKTANAWAKDPRANVASVTITKRIKAGQSPELAITTPDCVHNGNVVARRK